MLRINKIYKSLTQNTIFLSLFKSIPNTELKLPMGTTVNPTF